MFLFLFKFGIENSSFFSLIVSTNLLGLTKIGNLRSTDGVAQAVISRLFFTLASLFETIKNNLTIF